MVKRAQENLPLFLIAAQKKKSMYLVSQKIWRFEKLIFSIFFYLFSVSIARAEDNDKRFYSL